MRGNHQGQGANGSLTVFIITAPRKVHYLGMMLESLWVEFPSITPHVFAEPNTPSFFGRSKCIMHHNTEQLGCPQNWFSALCYDVDTDWLMICEDDIFFRPGSGDVIRDAIQSNTANVYSPYCSMVHGIPGKTGWQRSMYGTTGLCGALCFVMDMSIRSKILSDKPKFDHLSEGKHLDFPIGEFIREDVYFHMPSLISHLGEISTFPPPRLYDRATDIARTVYDGKVEKIAE